MLHPNKTAIILCKQVDGIAVNISFACLQQEDYVRFVSMVPKGCVYPKLNVALGPEALNNFRKQQMCVEVIKSYLLLYIWERKNSHMASYFQVGTYLALQVVLGYSVRKLYGCKNQPNGFFLPPKSKLAHIRQLSKSLTKNVKFVKYLL